MYDVDIICMWTSILIPLVAALISFIYGASQFFKRGKPLCMQSLAMAMASHALGSIYQLCLTVSNEDILEGFTPAYLGRIGFFLFLITASYGQLDRIVDDGTRRMRPARLIALIAPVVASLIFVPNMLLEECPTSSKVAYAIVWIPAIISVYFNMKHAIIPDLDFGFVKAIKPYNIFVLLLSIAELLCLTAWNYFYNFQMILTACIFAILCILTMIAAKRGVEKWTI